MRTNSSIGRRLLGVVVFAVVLSASTATGANAQSVTWPTAPAVSTASPAEVGGSSQGVSCPVPMSATDLQCVPQSPEGPLPALDSGSDGDWLLFVGPIMRFAPHVLAVLWLVTFVRGLVARPETAPARLVAVERVRAPAERRRPRTRTAYNGYRQPLRKT